MKTLGKLLCRIGFHAFEVVAQGGSKGHYWEESECTRCGAKDSWSNY